MVANYSGGDTILQAAQFLELAMHKKQMQPTVSGVNTSYGGLNCLFFFIIQNRSPHIPCTNGEYSEMALANF